MCSVSSRQGECASQSHRLRCAPMAIPTFGQDGRLPLGPPLLNDDGNELGAHEGHQCSLAEVKTALVDKYSLSQTRTVLFRELEKLVGVATDFLGLAGIWISGAFVVDVENPKDIFVVLDVPGLLFGSIRSQDRWVLGRVFDNGVLVLGDNDELRVETGLCRAFPRTHPAYELGWAERLVNREMAGKPFADAPGGYLELFHVEGGYDNYSTIGELFATGDRPTEAT